MAAVVPDGRRHTPVTRLTAEHPDNYPAAALARLLPSSRAGAASESVG